MSDVKRFYGYRPDPPDPRDRLYKAGPPESLPLIVDLRCTPAATVFNQGKLNSCTANAIVSDIMRVDPANWDAAPPSRLFLYFQGRVLGGTQTQDNGACIRDVIKAANLSGVCSETLWPYVESKVNDEPSPECLEAAKGHLALQYESLDTNYDFRHCLANWRPFVFGATVYESFESDEVAKTGMVPMPGANEREVGGHAMLCVGYDDSRQLFVVQNSWGVEWGDCGHCYFPYAYFSSMDVNDCWAIDKME